ncbi:MAG: HAD hydrolase-like protein [Planctomycetota bacterium]
MSGSARGNTPAVILDLDGTMADTLNDITNAVNYALDCQQREPIGPDTVRGLVGDGLAVLMSRAGQTSDEALIAFLVRRFKEHYDEHCLAHTCLYDGAERFLTRCAEAGVLLAILSNKPHLYTLLICDDLLDRWTLTAIMGAHEGLPIKPHPAAALALADAMRREPADVFIVGDSVVDIETARAAGMPSVAVTWGFQDRGHLQNARPDYLVDDFDQLWEVIRTGARREDALR